MALVTNIVEPGVEVDNNGESNIPKKTKEKQLVFCNAKQPRFSAPLDANLENQTKASSRSAVMLRMALRDNASLAQTSCGGRTARQKISHTVKWSARKELRCDLKELLPEHLEYLSEHSVGSGSYGQCFHAHYRGIDVVIKHMTHNNNTVDQEKARKNLLHEAGVITSLGDHASLPMIFGVITKTLPLCLVTQFHGVKEESINKNKG